MAELQGAELAAEVARKVMGWEQRDEYGSGERWEGSCAEANSGYPYFVADHDYDYDAGCPDAFRPDLDANHLREVLEEIERRGLRDSWCNIMLRFPLRDRIPVLERYWHFATCDPALACRAALEAVGGGE